MRYNVITCMSARLLVENVNYAIEDGWQPAGGVSHMHSRDMVNPVWAQALVRKDDSQAAQELPPIEFVVH